MQDYELVAFRQWARPLLTGIFGMNFIDMSLLKDRDGFWITMGMMGMTVGIALLVFRRKRFLEDRGTDS